MLKRILALALAAAIMMAVCACAEAPEEQKTTETEAHMDPEAEEQKEETEEEEAAEEMIPEPSFAEQVLVEDDNCTVKITGIETDSIWGYTLKLFLENKTDVELMYTVDDVSVNGFMCDPFWASTVTANMKSNEEISFSEEAFDRNGIESPTEITFTLRVYDSNDWEAPYLVEQEFTIYPLGEAAVQEYVREAGPQDIILCDNEYCTIIATGFVVDEIWGYTMQVYLENKTDVELLFSADGVAVNGFMCDPFWAERVTAGNRSNTELVWSEDAFVENGIEEVTEIVLPFRVYDNNNWETDDFVNETYTVNP